MAVMLVNLLSLHTIPEHPLHYSLVRVADVDCSFPSRRMAMKASAEQ
jgi:hypothetical protein